MISFIRQFLLSGALLLPLVAQGGIVTTNSTSTTAYLVSSTDLINGMLPTLNSEMGTIQPEEGQATDYLGALTNAAFGDPGLPGESNVNEVVTVHDNADFTFFLDTLAAPLGYNITGINTYAGWRDNGRDNQDYQVLFSTISNPLDFNLLAIVSFDPGNFGSPSDTAVFLTDNSAGGVLASNVAALRFTFPTTENGYVGYREIDVFGHAVPEPVGFTTWSMLAIIGALYFWGVRCKA